LEEWENTTDLEAGNTERHTSLTKFPLITSPIKSQRTGMTSNNLMVCAVYKQLNCALRLAPPDCSLQALSTYLNSQYYHSYFYEFLQNGLPI
jgi:hypothetical protein